MERNRMALTPSQEEEVRRCARDFVYFCGTYLKINHPKHGLIPFKLQDFQQRYFRHLEEHRFTLVKKFRQGGFTTFTIAYLFWKCMFVPGHRALFIVRTEREG